MDEDELRLRVRSLKTRKANVRFDELDGLLAAAGFKKSAGVGDHWKYSHPNYPGILVIDPRRTLLPAYVSKAIRAIEQVMS